MNSRQRVLAALSGEPVDRIPWIPLCSPTYSSCLVERRQAYAQRTGRSPDFVPETRVVEEMLADLAFRVEFCRSIGADFMDWGWLPAYDLETGDSVVRRVEWQRTRQFLTYETPLGRLLQESVYSDQAKTTFPVTSLVKSPQDFRVYAYILEHTRVVPHPERPRQYLEIIGDAGVAFYTMPRPPVKHWLLREVLVEDLVTALYEFPQELARAEALLHGIYLEASEIAASTPVRVFMDTAVTGLGMISPTIYLNHYVGYTRQYSDIFHRRGKVFLNHASGEPLAGILADIPQSGIDGLYGISLPEFGHGDATLKQVRDAFGPDIAIIAGLEPHLLAAGTLQEIKEAAKYVVEQCLAIGGRVLLGTADDTPYGTPAENLAAVSEVVEQYGRR